MRARRVTTRTSEADAQSGAAADEGGVVGEAEILAGREQRHVARLPFEAKAAKAVVPGFELFTARKSTAIVPLFVQFRLLAPVQV